MATIHQVFDEDGRVVEQWDDGTETYTDFRTEPDTVRPYNFEEHERALAFAAAQTANANDATITTALQDALATLQTLLDTTNATINAGPAPYIKDLARVEKRLIRKLLRILDGTG